MSEGRERDALELALLVARANALIPLKSVSAPETFAALAAAKKLSDRNIGTDLQRISILYGLCASATLTANLNQALAFAREIIAAAERLDDPAYRVLGYRQLATIQFYTGDNRAALASLQKGRAYRDPQRQRALSYRFGWDQGLAILSFEVLVRLSLGLLDSAARLRDEVLAETEGHGHATTIASATFCVRIWPQFALKELPALEHDSAELAVFCTEKKVEQIRLLASVHHAYARAMREPCEANIAALRLALDALRKSGGNTGNSITLSNLADALLAADDLDGRQRPCGTALPLSTNPASVTGSPICIACPGSSRCGRRSPIAEMPRPASTRRSRSPKARTRVCSNCVRRPILAGYGRARERPTKFAP